MLSDRDPWVPFSATGRSIFRSNGAVFSMLLGLGKRAIYKNFGAGIYYDFGFPDYTKYYQLRQIARVNGFLLALTIKL